MLMDKPENAVEPPAQPPDAFCPDPPKSEHRYHYAPGHAYEASYGVAHCLKLLASQCACYSSDSDGEWNESSRDYANKPAAGLKLFEGAL